MVRCHVSDFFDVFVSGDVNVHKFFLLERVLFCTKKSAKSRRRERTPHMPPCACHCAVCRAAGHGNTCVLLRMGLLKLCHGKSDIVDLVLRHYNEEKPRSGSLQPFTVNGASRWDTACVDAEIRCVQYGPAGDVIAVGAMEGVCAQTGAKILCLKGHR